MFAAQFDHPAGGINIPGNWEKTEHGKDESIHLKSPKGQQVTVSVFSDKDELPAADFERVTQTVLDAQIKLMRQLLGDDAEFDVPELELKGSASASRFLRGNSTAKKQQAAVRVDVNKKRVRITFVHEPDAVAPVDFKNWSKAIFDGVQ